MVFMADPLEVVARRHFIVLARQGYAPERCSKAWMGSQSIDRLRP